MTGSKPVALPLGDTPILKTLYLILDSNLKCKSFLLINAIFYDKIQNAGYKKEYHMNALEKKMQSLLKILDAQKKYSSPSLDWKKFRENRVDAFFSDLLFHLEMSGDKKAFAKASDAFLPFKDMVEVFFQRDSLWEKMTSSKQKPKLRFLKDKKLIFDHLLLENEAFKKGISSTLDSELKFAKEALIRKYQSSEAYKIRNKKNSKRVFLSNGDIYDEEGDFKPHHLALIHVTGYKPRQDANGRYFLESSATATNLTTPRNTLHFTIGHHVHDHLAGGWGNLPYVLIVPMEKMIEENGKPMGISCVDTFFEVGLNENLVLPEGTHILEPAESVSYKLWNGEDASTAHNCHLKEGVLSATVGNRTFYKTNFTDEEKKSVRFGLGCDYPDDRLAEVNKKRQLSFLLRRLGYIDFSAEMVSDSPVAEKIANMGKKMGVRSIAGQTLHSVHAVSGVNRLGEGINNVCAVLTLLSNEKINALDLVDKKRIFKDLSEMSDLDEYLNKYSGYLGKGILTAKEEQVFNAWKIKAQSDIRKALEAHQIAQQKENSDTLITQFKKQR